MVVMSSLNGEIDSDKTHPYNDVISLSLMDIQYHKYYPTLDVLWRGRCFDASVVMGDCKSLFPGKANTLVSSVLHTDPVPSVAVYFH